MLEISLYILTGCVAGFMSGLIGIGGGLVIVPALDYIFLMHGMPHQSLMQMAAASSLATMIFTTSASVWSHHRDGSMDWGILKKMSLGIVIGTVIGALLADTLHSSVVRIIFGLLTFIISIQMLLQVSRTQSKHELPGPVVLNEVSTTIGSLSGLLGIGGSIFTIPFLTRFNVPMHTATAISVSGGFIVAVVGTVSFYLTGLNEAHLEGLTLGYIYLPAVIAISLPSMIFAVIGTKYSSRVPAKRLKQIFSVFLLFVSLHMLWR